VLVNVMKKKTAPQLENIPWGRGANERLGEAKIYEIQRFKKLKGGKIAARGGR